MMALAGSAWADVNSVKQAITNYGLTASDSGNTITVTGSVTKPANDVLELGNITGLTINWMANLTVTGGQQPDDKWMINFTNGTFNLAGGTIQLPQTIDGIQASGAATVRVNGGKIKSSEMVVMGFAVLDGTLIIDNGEINLPRGTVGLAKNLTVNNPSALTGLAFEGDFANYTATVYGHAIITKPVDLNDSEASLVSCSYVVADGATWDFEGVTWDLTSLSAVATVNMTVKSGGQLNLKSNTDLKFKGSLHVEQNGELNIDDTSRLTIVGGTAANDGKININGTMINKDKLINNPTGTITNNSVNTLDNQGTLTNKGAINNTGKITNTGTINSTGKIDNKDGTIKNDGTFQSAQSKEEMGGTVEGEVQPAGSSGGDGCNAGYGLLGLLLLAGLAASKRRA
jgi:hypothetical protein